ncbi:hypothetical protein ACFVT5_37145 [Streptomyces sp. NPDC058001]|uniref:hypothetical protein n=1 Tax=Streptomyces sp. NPDC058001 TaxID=3346300 RepID=UPI0036EBC430
MLLVRSAGVWELAGGTSRAGQCGTTCGSGDAAIYTDVTAHRRVPRGTALMRVRVRVRVRVRIGEAYSAATSRPVPFPVMGRVPVAVEHS